jgi:small subunit ribosomal protein S5
MSGLESLRRPEDVAKLRGISIREVLGVGNGASAEQEAPKEAEAPAAPGNQEIEAPKEAEAPAGEAVSSGSDPEPAEAEDASPDGGEEAASDGEAVDAPAKEAS